MFASLIFSFPLLYSRCYAQRRTPCITEILCSKWKHSQAETGPVLQTVFGEYFNNLQIICASTLPQTLLNFIFCKHLEGCFPSYNATGKQNPTRTCTNVFIQIFEPAMFIGMRLQIVGSTVYNQYKIFSRHTQL